MKKVKIGRSITIFLITLLFSLMLFQTPVYAKPPEAMLFCYASGCNGQYAPSAGCDSNVFNRSYKYITNGYVEMRQSVNCYARWTRVRNDYPNNWLAATIYFQPSLPSNYSLKSGGPLASGQTIYTVMAGADVDNRSCGMSNVTVGIPVANNSTYCTVVVDPNT